ncbi:hypothetical protein GRI89_16735 [Altererythrobacter salegens]|uniref:Glutamyl-tRNA amidotransferase n=1 Tax=Croceibacterium salegens TaxID=1737568 RepID=A0A6I4T385_9SPHN|nr:GatB/YqeY domain-containing protein [Croceibacterium salegens]MXO61192.1 hypothetical protein [Croceibacterium salegens]
MSAEQARARLRADLKDAMRAGRKDEVSLLRSLAAAIDNAEAVPVEGLNDNISPLRASAGMGEVARLDLCDEDIAAIFSREQAERIAAAAMLEKAGQAGPAERLRGEAGLIGRYL